MRCGLCQFRRIEFIEIIIQHLSFIINPSCHCSQFHFASMEGEEEKEGRKEGRKGGKERKEGKFRPFLPFFPFSLLPFLPSFLSVPCDTKRSIVHDG